MVGGLEGVGSGWKAVERQLRPVEELRGVAVEAVDGVDRRRRAGHEFGDCAVDELLLFDSVQPFKGGIRDCDFEMSRSLRLDEDLGVREGLRNGCMYAPCNFFRRRSRVCLLYTSDAADE